MVLSGSIELTLDGKVHRLEADDSFWFASSLRLRYDHPLDSE